jgi:hypothetical protein
VAGHVGCPVSDRVTPPKSIAHELALAHLPSKNATGLRRFNDVVSAPRRGGVSSARALVSVCPVPGFFENSQKNLRRARIKKLFRKWQAQQGENLVFQKKIRDSGSSPRILGSPSGKLDPQVFLIKKPYSSKLRIAHTRTIQSIHALPELSCPLPVSELRLVAQRPRSSRDCPCPDGEQRCRGGGHP